MSKEIREFVDIDGVRKKKSWIERVKERFRENVPVVMKKEKVEKLAKRQETLKKMVQRYQTQMDMLLSRMRSDPDAAGELGYEYLKELDYVTSVAEEVRLKIDGNSKKKKKFKAVEAVSRFLRTTLGWFGIYAAPVDFGSEQYNAQRSASWVRYFLDPVAGNIVDKLVFFSLGKGVKISALAEEADNYIQSLLRDYRFSNNQKWDYRRTVLDGEIHYLLRRNDEKKLVEMERLISRYINDIKYYRGNPIYYQIDSSFFGEDGEDKWYRSARYDEFGGDMLEDSPQEVEDDAVVYTIKYGDSRRGEPFLIRVLRWCQIYEEFDKDVARMMHEKARILLKKIISQNMADNPQQTTIKDAPPGGYMLIAVKGETDYEFMNVSLDGSGLKEVARILRAPICAGTHTPEHIAFEDASNENYASILEAKNPYIVFVEFRQDWYAEELKQFFRTNIKMAVDAGYIPDTVMSKRYRSEALEIQASEYILEELVKGDKIEEVLEGAKNILGEYKGEKIPTEDVVISVIFPSLRSEDQLKLAQAMQIHYDLGIDLETIWKKLGYNPQEILLNKIKEKERQKEEEEENLMMFNQGRSTTPPDFMQLKSGDENEND